MGLLDVIAQARIALKRLPRAARQDPQPSSPASTPRLPCVLLVDDMSMTAQALSRLLTSEGYRVHVAASIASAESDAARTKFDLVISDLILPDGTGIDVLGRVRQKSGSHDLPGIVLSGAASQRDVEKLSAAGYAAFLTKPCDIDELLRTVRDLTARR